VFWGTLFPIISEAVRGVKITVGPPFFNSVITPLGLALLFLTGLCPIVAWRRSTLKKFTRKILYPCLFSLIGACVLILFDIRSFYPLVTFTLCIFVVVVLFAEFLNGTRARHSLSGESYLSAFWNLVSRNKRRYGGYVIHLGMVFIFMGFAGNAFNTEKQITLNKGESFSIKNYTLKYEALSNYPTTQMDKTVATLTLFNDNHKVGILSPEKSLYKGQNQPTTEVAIHSTLKEDVYVILAGYEKDMATFKVLVNPLVIWLWIGGGIMGLGTVIVMLPNRKKSRRPSVVS
jgi:cytochrome c-type biogenesis protein CcmF